MLSAAARSVFRPRTSWLSRAFVPARSYTAAPPSGLSEGEQDIFTKLTERFSPSALQVADVSGASHHLLFFFSLVSEISRVEGGCGTFYAISITSEAFKGLPIVKQHRLVNDTLKKEIEGIHGLQVRRNAF
jgi:BolA-like protein 3